MGAFEAVLCGTPIIVTEHTGSGEDVKRIDAGYTVKFDDVEGLAGQFSYIFANYSAAKEKTMAAKRYIEENMSMNARSQEYIELYQKAIAKVKQAKKQNSSKESKRQKEAA